MRSTTATLSLLASTVAALRSSGNGELAGAQPAVAPKRVAIIGAGASGSSAAYHLAQRAHDAGIPVQIDVFERASHIGGRSTTVNPWSDPAQAVELGASIFVEVNQILVNATKAFNLSVRSSLDLEDTVPEVGIWNGKEVVFTMNEGGWWDIARLFWRYGYAPVKANALMKETVGKFLRMYERPVFPWRSLSDVVQLVGLTEVTGLTGEQYLKNKGIGEKFSNEIIQASTRVNYASNLGTIHGVEAMVCLATNGAMSIAGGNWQIFSHMLHSSPSITTHLNTSITHITTHPSHPHTLTTSSNQTLPFDDIIIATPFQFSNLTITPAPHHLPDKIPYVHLHVTHFASPLKLSPSAFGLEPNTPVPQHILTTLQPDESTGPTPHVGRAGFFSISTISTGFNTLLPSPRPEYIYKIFSPHRIDEGFLSRVLRQTVTNEEAERGVKDGTVSWINHWEVDSYPVEYPRVSFEEVEVGRGVWYAGGMESFISTMETSALGGRNVAELVVEEWSRKGEEGKAGSEEAEGVDTGVGWEFEVGGQKPLGGAFQGRGVED